MHLAYFNSNKPFLLSPKTNNLSAITLHNSKGFGMNLTTFGLYPPVPVVLLMDPLPPINKVFSLILQEERQREVASITHPAMEPAALLSHQTPHPPRNDGKRGPPPFKRERPFCNHCHIHGHTTARCYKLHGYPPGHRLHQPPSANQVSGTDIPTATPQLPFTKEQCEQLLGLLNISSSQPMANHVNAGS
ncbi:hypothetical protein F0562_018405 [Nyssa sinensis]|uniref:Uncharacterized protein n=1 Tax=Nyssa sinensis TaxID=561372 RepID=A0A5J4Z9X4_9ASTE|nr:hypothetical protein F0562_018405 [Nyssa sinensis]